MGFNQSEKNVCLILLGYSPCFYLYNSFQYLKLLFYNILYSPKCFS